MIETNVIDVPINTWWLELEQQFMLLIHYKE